MEYWFYYNFFSPSLFFYCYIMWLFPISHQVLRYDIPSIIFLNIIDLASNNERYILMNKTGKYIDYE